jgi:putative tryptophan/tyrosine transport system substrate-binding protein
LGGADNSSRRFRVFWHGIQRGGALCSGIKLGLEEAGYIEGKNVAVEYHFPGGNDESLPGLMVELVQRHVAVIVGDTSAAIAAKKATSTIPIVFLTGADPERRC